MNDFCFLVLLTFMVATVHAEEEPIHGENGWYMPQLNGTDIWMYKYEVEAVLAELRDTGMSCGDDEANVEFHLHTNENPNIVQQIFKKTYSIKDSNFNPKNPTRIIIHGWLSKHTSETLLDIKTAWLSKGDYNIIMVDWRCARNTYVETALESIPGVSKIVASMVDFLATKFNMSLDTLHIIGHSLGAHVAGYTGKNVESGKIRCIVGLDPALPGFLLKTAENRLAATDAKYVQIIHTNGGKVAFLTPIGQSDFYVNGGRRQLNCQFLIGCSHSRSQTYYAEAVERNNFVSIKCSYFLEAVFNVCGSSISSVRMGATTEEEMVPGIYYVPVNSDPPYGMGY